MVISKKSNWLNRVFTDTIMCSKEHCHLLIDLQAESGYNPTIFRSNTDTVHLQVCFLIAVMKYIIKNIEQLEIKVIDFGLFLSLTNYLC